MQRRIFAHAFDVTADPVGEQAALFDWFDFGPRRQVIQSMFGVDLRDPTADKRVYEFCFSIPPEQYIAEGHSRSLVRRAMKGRIPESTRLNYRRGLQGADWHMAMSEVLPAIGEEVTDIERSPAARHWIDVARLRELLESWPSSGYESTAVTNLWHHALIRAVSLGYFLRTYDPAVVSGRSETALHFA
jgi:asparagine synthase (glutamine-hydrolysing)